MEGDKVEKEGDKKGPRQGNITRETSLFGGVDL